jgi:hypothetical protein
MLRAGTVAAAIYNANPFRSSDSRPISPTEFVPSLRRQEAPQSLDEQIRVLSEVFGCGPAPDSN